MNARLLAAAAAVSLGAGIGITVATVPAGATTPACAASQLRPHYDGQQGAAGTLYDLWHFVNVGATCQTIGFVGARNFGSDGRPLPVTGKARTGASRSRTRRSLTARPRRPPT
jgi:hypothetical protein